MGAIIMRRMLDLLDRALHVNPYAARLAQVKETGFLLAVDAMVVVIDDLAARVTRGGAAGRVQARRAVGARGSSNLRVSASGALRARSGALQRERSRRA